MTAPSHQLSRLVIRVTEQIYERVHQQVERRQITLQAWAHERLMAALEGAEAVATEPGADLSAVVLHLESRLTEIVAQAQAADRLNSWIRRLPALYAAFNEFTRDRERLADEEAQLEQQLAAARSELIEPSLAVEAEQPAAATTTGPTPASAPATAEVVESAKVEPEQPSPANTEQPRERELELTDFATPLEAALALFKEQGIDVGGS